MNLDLDDIFCFLREEAEKRGMFDLFESEEKVKDYDIYNILPKKIITYLECLSRIYGAIKESEKGKNYSDLSIINISIVLEILLSQKKLSLYFTEKGITLDELLKHLNLSIVDIDNTKVNKPVMNFIYENTLLDKLDKLDLNFIYLTVYSCLSQYDEILSKILGDINDYFYDKNIYSDMSTWANEQLTKERIKVYQELYSDLSIDVIKYIESSYKNYEQLKYYLDEGYSNDDIVEISLLLTYYNYDKSFMSYIRDELFKENDLYEVFNIKNLGLTDSIYNKDVDIDIISNNYRKYIFDGKNKGKEKKQITIESIVNNLFNKELNDSFMLKNVLSRFNLTYDNFLHIENNYREYMKEELENYKDFNFELVDNIDKIYRTIFKSNSLTYADEVYLLSTYIYLFYTDSYMVKYLVHRGITLEKISEYLNISKEEIDNFKNLESDYDRIKNKCSDFIYDKSAEEILLNLIQNENALYYRKFTFNLIITNLTKFVKTNKEELFYELLNDEFYEEKIKKDCINKIEDNQCNFKLIDILDKIYRLIENLENNFKNEQIIELSSLIYLYYYENDIVNYLIDRGITLEKIAEYLDISKEEIDKFNSLDTEYIHIDKIFSTYKSINNIDDILKLIIGSLFNDGTYQCKDDIYIKSQLCEISEFTNNDFTVVKYELLNKEKYLTKKEQLENYRKMLVPKLEVGKVDEILRFGDDLTKQAELITKDFEEIFVYNIGSGEDNSELQQLITMMFKEKNKKWFNFGKKEQVVIDKKEVLDKINKYLEEKEIYFKYSIEKLQHIQASIAIYLAKAKEYLNVLGISKEELKEEIKKKVYIENDITVHNDYLKQQLLNDKEYIINSFIINMINEYQRITLQIGTHSQLLNNISLSKNIALQKLYIELSLNEGIIQEKESIKSLKYLSGLISSLTNYNQENIEQNIRKIQGLSRHNRNVSITEKQQLAIGQILDEQMLLPDSRQKKKTL